MNYVTCKRVITNKQGKSGLGLDARERDIKLFLSNYADPGVKIIADFVEIQTGSKDNREELVRALELCRKEEATLLVSKLDRLSRKVSFIARLMEDKKVNFRVAQMPTADSFQLHIYAALAEQERDFISKRTTRGSYCICELGVVAGLSHRTYRTASCQADKGTGAGTCSEHRRNQNHIRHFRRDGADVGFTHSAASF